MPAEAASFEECGWCSTPCPVAREHSTPMCDECLERLYPADPTDPEERGERARIYLAGAARRRRETESLLRSRRGGNLLAALAAWAAVLVVGAISYGVWSLL